MAGTAQDLLERLAALGEEVEREFAAIQRRRSASMECRPGCSDCCRARLSITRVEAALLHRGLVRMPAVEREELSRRARAAKQEMCPALDARGRCTVYASRPLICRSYGVPLRRRREVVLIHPPIVDVCDKNFRGTNLKTLPTRDVLDQTGLEAVVSAIDTDFCARNGLPQGERIPVAHLLADPDPDATDPGVGD